jgi:hypothetical protein
MPFLAQFPKSASDLYSPYGLGMHANPEPPRSVCKTTSILCKSTSGYVQNHLGLHAKPPRSLCKTTSGCVPVSACIKTPPSGSVPMPHLNNGKANQKGAWAIGHAPTQIPSISTLFKVIAPPLATSHSGGALVVVVVRGGGSPGSNPRASPPTACDFDI